MLSHRNPKPGNRLPSHALGIHTQWLKRDPNKGELLQLPKEAFEVLQPCHIMTAISSEWGTEIKTKRQHMSSTAGWSEPSSGAIYLSPRVCLNGNRKVQIQILCKFTSRKLTQVVLSKCQKIYSTVEAPYDRERNQDNHRVNNFL